MGHKPREDWATLCQPGLSKGEQLNFRVSMKQSPARGALLGLQFLTSTLWPVLAIGAQLPQLPPTLHVCQVLGWSLAWKS